MDKAVHLWMVVQETGEVEMCGGGRMSSAATWVGQGLDSGREVIIRRIIG